MPDGECGVEKWSIENVMEYINKIYFSHWMPLEVSERMWSVNLMCQFQERIRP